MGPSQHVTAAKTPLAAVNYHYLNPGIVPEQTIGSLVSQSWGKFILPGLRTRPRRLLLCPAVL